MATSEALQVLRKFNSGDPAAGLQQPALDPVQLIAGLMAPGVLSGIKGMASMAPGVMGSESGALFPEQLAKLNATDFYHGSSTPGLTSETINPLMTSHENLFGQGLYATDNPAVAGSYAGKQGAQSALYKMRLNATKGLDLEAPLEPDFRDTVLGQADKISQRFGLDQPQSGGMANYNPANGIREAIANGTIKTNQDVFKHFRGMIRDISAEEGIPTSEFVDDFQELADSLKSQGHQVMTHTGGLRAGGGKLLHKVAVVLDPKALMNFTQVK